MSFFVSCEHLMVHDNQVISYTAVSGDANFSMDVTALTIGGFTQPMVARNLIELQASVEKDCPQDSCGYSPNRSMLNLRHWRKLMSHLHTP